MKRIMGREELLMLKQVITTQKLCRLDRLENSFTARFERDFAKYLGVKNVLAVNSGSAALQAALAACGVGPGDEVICTAFSYISSSGCVLNQNAVPVFADVDPRTLCIDPADIERKITDRTKAIIPVHIFGQPCDMDKIMAIAKKHKLFVIEDCCQAYSSRYGGKYVGTIGDIGCFSLQMTKHITCGDGGMAVTNNSELFEKISLVSNYGQQIGKKYNHFVLGWNFRLAELLSAVAIAQLKKIDKFNAERKRFVDLIEAALKDVPAISPAFVPDKCRPNYWLYPMWYNEDKAPFPKAEFLKRCKDASLSVGFADGGYIPRPNYLEPVFKDMATYGHNCPFDCKWYGKKIEYKEGVCPVLEKTMPRLLMIDIHHSRSSADIRKTVVGMREILESVAKIYPEPTPAFGHPSGGGELKSCHRQIRLRRRIQRQGL